MLNGMVLVCADCGNVEIKVNYIDDGTKIVNFYCPKCGNVGRMQGFTAGPIILGAVKVKEIKDRAEKPKWKKSKRRAESDLIIVKKKEKGIPETHSHCIL